MNDQEVERFYFQSFGSAHMGINQDAMEVMVRYSGGIPRLMHLIGDAAFWRSNGETIDRPTAVAAIFDAAEDLGAKFVDPQVYRALRSQSYRRILSHLSGLISAEFFTRTALLEAVGGSDRRNVDNFLSRMRRLEVIRSGDARGSYEFRDSLTRLYVALTANQQLRT